jgi:cell division transport system permease protein
MAVLAIALALPGGLYVLSQNLLSLSEHWDTDTQITLYLNHDIDNQQAQLFANQLKRDPRFTGVSYLSRADALEEFRQMTEFQHALEYITDNPLPAVILLTPTASMSPDALADIRKELVGKSQVELAQLDLEWIKRLRGIIEIIQHAVLIIAIILAVAVILVVGNTIRLEIENRREEIVITKLFGATHAYIRRPFLYDGLWYGLFGGLIASLLIVAALSLLSEPVMRLITLYESSFSLIFPDAAFIAGITALGGLLGYLGAWSAVSQHLYKIEPE